MTSFAYIDHVTYCVPNVQDERIGQLAQLLGWKEFVASEQYQQQFVKGRYLARWFHMPMGMCDIHLVEGDYPHDRGLEHLCIMKVGDETYERAKASPLCARSSGSGRVWLAGPGSLRIEVQP